LRREKCDEAAAIDQLADETATGLEDWQLSVDSFFGNLNALHNAVLMRAVATAC
jgi:hypothetical protein